MASHNRPEITKRSCSALQAMGCEVVLVVSTNSDLERLKEFNPYLFPNEPLGAKWQYAVSMARQKNPDLLLTCGSDDILNENYLKSAIMVIHRGYDFVGVSQWYMEDVRKKTIWKAWYKHLPNFPVGSGRIYSKKLLDSINWQIFDRKASRRLDEMGFYASSVRFKKYVSQDVEKDGLMITAVKGNWSMLNPIEKFFNVNTIGIKKMDI